MDPGFDVLLRDEPVPRPGPTRTDTWFVLGITERGPTDAPVLSVSDAGFTDVFGGDIAASYLPITAQRFFLEGGRRLYTQRVVGPDAVKATASFNDSTPAATLAVDGLAAGAWYNGLRITILDEDDEGIDDDSFAIQVENEDGDILELSPNFTTKTDAVSWSEISEYVRVRSLAGTGIPVGVTQTALTLGDDDIAGITNDDYIAALAKLPKRLGPGQVSVPGSTNQALRSIISEHCAIFNRRAVFASPNSGSRSVLESASLAHKLDYNSRFSAMFGPWDIIAGRFGVTRTIPPEGRIAGTIARVDLLGNPNQPAAGDNGRAIRTLDVSHNFSDEDYTKLNLAGCNMSRTVFGRDVAIYGFRTLVDPDEDPRWVEFSGSRTVMYVTAHANARMATFAFDQIDGQGHKFAELEGSLTEICLPLHTMGALYGKEPQDAYTINAGPTVNTVETVRNRELHAVITLCTSPFAEHVVTEIVRRMVGEGVA